jgi:hypothetical protein
MIVGGLPVNTVITGQQIIDGAGGGGGAVGYYAQYQDDISQPLAVVNVGQPVKFRTMDFSNGVTVNSDTEITIANTGIYNLQFSFQYQNVDSQEHDVTIWLRKNGSDVAGSAGFVAVVSSHGGIPGHCIPSWNYLLDAVGGDYYELYWSATSTQVTLHYYPGSLPPPSAASAIFTVTQQAGIIAGTGMTALNGLSADIQTISTGTTGSDFNVVSSGSNHQFNIPTASAISRGVLSTTDWSTFNNKQDTLVSGTNIKTVNGNSLVGSGNVNIGPRLIGWSGILGTPTTGTAVGICHSILIPANTLGTNNILQLVFRMYRQSGNAGQLYGRIYSNTTNSISGATLIGGLFTINGGGVQFVAYCERNYSYDGTNLRTISATSFSEYAAGTIQSTALNRTVNQYILFTMQAQNLADTGNVDLVKVFAYV